MPPSTEPWLTVHVMGPPQGKGRARSFRTDTGIGHYTPKQTKAYEKLIKQEAIVAMNKARRKKLARLVEVRMEIGIYVEVLIAKPDMDNIEKAILDAFNGTVWTDDVQVVKKCTEKRLFDQPQLVIDVYI